MEKKSSALGFVWFLNLCLQSFPQNSTLFLEKWSSDELEWVRRICDCKRMLRRPIQNRKDKASGAWFLMSRSRTSADTERRDWNQQSCSSHCGICSISPPTIVLALAVLWMQFDARSPWADFLRTERKHRNLNHMTNSLKFLINVHSGYSSISCTWYKVPYQLYQFREEISTVKTPQVSWDWEKALDWCTQPFVLMSCRNSPWFVFCLCWYYALVIS